MSVKVRYWATSSGTRRRIMRPGHAGPASPGASAQAFGRPPTPETPRAPESGVPLPRPSGESYRMRAWEEHARHITAVS